LGLLAQFSARLLIELKGLKLSPTLFKTNEKRLNSGRILSRIQNWDEKQAQLSEKFLLGSRELGSQGTPQPSSNSGTSPHSQNVPKNPTKNCIDFTNKTINIFHLCRERIQNNRV
jgi:hypothetical protein